MINNPTWEISNSSLKRMDNERVKLNLATASFERQLYGDPFLYASLTTGNEIGSRAKNLLRRSSRIDRSGLGVFDRAIYDDIACQAKMAEAYHSYFVNASSSMGIGAFLSAFCGPGTYSGFLNAVRPENMPHDLMDREERIKAEVFGKTPDTITALYGYTSWAREKQSELAKALQEAKGPVDKFYRGLSVSPMEYNLQPGAAGGGFSYWHFSDKTAAIDPDRLPYVGGKYSLVLGAPILAHELGHAHHEAESENLPRGLSPREEGFSAPFHGRCAEGVALAVEDKFVDFAESRMDLTGPERLLIRTFWDTYLPKKLFNIAHAFLDKKEGEECTNPNFPESLKIDAHEKLAEITRIKYFEDIYSIDDIPLIDILPQVNYHLGNVDFARIRKRFRRERVPMELRVNAIFQGMWTNPQAQEDFIFNCYLPRMKGK